MKVDISKMVTLDFETYYAADYTLSAKIHNTSSYIRDPQFKVHCVAIKIGKDKTKCYEGTAIEPALRKIDWTTYSLLAQNTAFDGLILSHHYGIVPCFYYDTMGMTRGLLAEVSRAKLEIIAKFFGVGEKSKTYLSPTKGLRDLSPAIMKGLKEGCILDVDLCYEIALKQFEVYPEEELELIDWHIRVFTDSKLLIDEDRARLALAEEMLERRSYILKSGLDEKGLCSNATFAAALTKLGVEPPVKISLRTGVENFAFAQSDSEFIDLLDHEKLKVRRLVEGRLAAKSSMAEARAARFIQAGENGMVLPVGYNYYGAKCVPGHTEVLTPRGWIAISDWDEREVIAQVTAGSQDIEFLPATKFVGPVETDWIRFDAPYVKADFTFGHTVPYLRQHFAWATMKAEDAEQLSQFYIPISGVLQAVGNLTPEQMRVIVMAQADGSFQTDSSIGRGLRISVKKPRKISRARQLLRNAGVPFRDAIYHSQPGYVHFIVRAADYPAWLSPRCKTFGAWLLDSTPEAREAFIEELTHWDGWIQGGQCCYSSTSLPSADWVATLAHLTGRSATTSVTPASDGRVACYNVRLRQRSYAMAKRAQRDVFPVKQALQTFCPQTQTGFWLARSNGRIFITGNTGRPSGTNKLNLMNLPRVNKDEPKPSDGLRHSITAPPGHVLVVTDSAQIEARVNAWQAQQDDLLELFAAKQDVYSVFASENIYGIPLELIDKLQRFIGKIAILGLGYNMGALKFQTTLAQGIMGPAVNISLTDAKRIVNAYRGKNIRIAQSWKEAQRVVEQMAAGNSGTAFHGLLEYEPCTIWLPNGMGLHYPGLHRTETGDYKYKAHEVWKKVYGGLIIENIVQALARIIVMKQLLWTRDWLTTLKLKKGEVARVSMMTYDEIVSCVPERYADKVLAQQIKFMRTCPAGFEGLPLDAEGGWDFKYSK